MSEAMVQGEGDGEPSSVPLAFHERLLMDVEEFTTRVHECQEHSQSFDWFFYDFAPFTDLFTRVLSRDFAADEVKMATTQLWDHHGDVDSLFINSIKAKNFMEAFAFVIGKIQAILLVSSRLDIFRLMHGTTVQLWNRHWGKKPVYRGGPSIQGLGPQETFTQGLEAILVRSEYEVACQAIQEWQRRNPTGGMTITGPDGSGKSLFLFYLLTLRLSAKETTILQAEPGYYTVFCQDGVYRIPNCKQLKTLGLDVPIGTWALVDPNECDFGPPTESQEKGTSFFVIEATPVRYGRRSVWTKEESTIGTFLMMPWSSEEIPPACSMQLMQVELSEEESDRFYHDYGPVPRLVNRFTQSSEFSEYAISINSIVRSLRWSHLLHALKRGEVHCTAGWSSKLILIEPAASDNRSDFRVSIVTWTVKRLLWEGLWDRSHPIIKEDAKEFFDLALVDSRTLALAHWMLEFAVRDDLLKCGTWALYRMMAKPPVNQFQTFTYSCSRTMRSDPTNHCIKHLNHTPFDPLNAVILEPGSYYAIGVLNHPGFPYFTYDPDDHDGICLTILDVAASYGPHAIDVEGLNQLCQFAEGKGINTQRIRYVVTIDHCRPVELEVVVPLSHVALIDLYVLEIFIA